MNEMITTPEAAHHLNLSMERIRQLISEGKLPGSRKIGRDWLIPLKEIKNVKVYNKSGRPKKILGKS